MKFNLIPVAVMLLGMVGGCATKPAATNTALDVGPGAPAQSVTYTPTPVTASPVLAAPDSAYSQTPLGGSSTSGGSYTVKKGDTLYRIAKEHYGDGKQWQRIASANPGVTPQSLKVGQTLVLP